MAVSAAAVTAAVAGVGLFRTWLNVIEGARGAVRGTTWMLPSHGARLVDAWLPRPPADGSAAWAPAWARA